MDAPLAGEAIIEIRNRLGNVEEEQDKKPTLSLFYINRYFLL
jgi:hypothetical protein